MDTWENDTFHLFISHTSKNSKDCTKLKDELKAYGISGFVAHADVQPTLQWQDVIENALHTADALAAMLTKDFVNSKWCDQEVGVAIGRGTLVVPVRLGADPHGFIGKYQGYTASDKNFKLIAKNLAEILINNKSTSSKMTHALVSLFENSDSFAGAKDNMDKLEMITALPSELATRIKSAQKNNGQIRSSFGVPERVKTLLKKYGY